MSGDTVAFLLESAGRIPIPSKSEQLCLGRRIQAGLKPDATAAQKRSGARAKERLIAGNMRLAVSIAKSMKARIAGRPGLDFEDLIQEGCLGLNRAAEKYNPESGYAFSTYATWWIKQAVARVIEMQSDTIRRSIDAQSIARQWRYKPYDQSLEEFCQARGYSRQKVVYALRQHALTYCTSLDSPARAEFHEGSNLVELIAAPVDQDRDEIEIFRQALENMADWLPDDLCLIELARDHKQKDLAELQGVGKCAIGKQIKEAKSRLQQTVDLEVREALAA